MKKSLPGYRLNFFCLLAFLCLASGSYGQNLLANPSFELINYCCEYGSKCAPKGWFNTNLTGVNSTIFVERAVTDFGKRCIQLKLIDINRPQKRQYAFSPLLCTLEKDEYYYFSVWVRASHLAVKQLHVILDDSMHVQFEDRVIVAEPSIILKNKKKKFIYHKKEKWVNLTAVYQANGTEKYLTLGYLTPEHEVEYKMIRKSAKIAYMSIDSISLVPMNKVASCNLDEARRLFFSEQRRHIFNRPCGDSSFNMFPFLLRTPREQEAITITGNEAASKPEEEMQVKMWRNLVFGFNRADLQAQSFPVIDSLIEDLSVNPALQVKITGHTDNYGNADYNFNLSEQRAKAVADYMISKGISNKRITWVGVGDRYPVADNTTETGRAVNRRVEFEFYVK
jgi:outer membrane protein OmpA-like peptidoglycan-associated protein